MESLKSKYANIIIRQRITEKATLVQEGNVYVFEINPEAGKKEVAAAVRVFYGVSPIKVAVAKNPIKKVFLRGKFGKSGGVKKAYVYLKKGETINLS